MYIVTDKTMKKKNGIVPFLNFCLLYLFLYIWGEGFLIIFYPKIYGFNIVRLENRGSV